MTVRLSAQGLCYAVHDAAGLPRWVLYQATGQFQAGTLTLLSGHNGAGKSTLLGLLAGHLQAESGQIMLDGVALPQWGSADLARRLAVLAHKPGLYHDLTATENLHLLAQLAGVAVTPAQIQSALERVGIAAADQHRPVRYFSRGMQQRTALARIQLSGADVWLLDEPSTGLDRDGQQLLGAVLDDATRRGATVLVTTHEPGFLRKVDQHLRVERGRLVAAEAP